MAITLQRTSSALGAEVMDVDLASPAAHGLAEKIGVALAQHGVLVFRDQRLTPEQHIAFSRCFGELEEHVLADALLAGHKEIYVLSNVVENGKPKGRSYSGTYWHSDMSYKPLPAMGSLLYAFEVPAVGGDTLFANMYRAYETLSVGMRRLLDGLHTVHDFGYADRVYFSRRADGGQLTPQQRLATPPATHPAVRTHPVTGRRALFVNPGFTARCADMTEEESRPLLDFLCRHATGPDLVYRHEWRAGDLVFWDNRCTMHKALRDYRAPRHMHRTTVRGEAPVLVRD